MSLESRNGLLFQNSWELKFEDSTLDHSSAWYVNKRPTKTETKITVFLECGQSCSGMSGFPKMTSSKTEDTRPLIINKKQLFFQYFVPARGFVSLYLKEIILIRTSKIKERSINLV